MGQEQPLRRRRAPGLGPVAGVEHRQRPPWIPASDADINQRADDVPDHVAQEPIACYPDDQRQVESAAVFDVEGMDGALGRRHRRAGPLEAGEVVAADQRSGSRAHRLGVEWLGNVPHVAVQERRHERGIHDAVFVGLRARVEAGVEARRHLLDGQHAHVERQHGIHRPRERRALEHVDDHGARHLPHRVHAGVGPPRTMDGGQPVLDRRQRIFEQLLNRDAARLPLPSDVVGAVGTGR